LAVSSLLDCRGRASISLGNQASAKSNAFLRTRVSCCQREVSVRTEIEIIRPV
jgi:hypothetical protein